MAETRQALLKRLDAEARRLRRNVWRALRAGGGGHAGGSSSANPATEGTGIAARNVGRSASAV